MDLNCWDAHAWSLCYSSAWTTRLRYKFWSVQIIFDSRQEWIHRIFCHAACSGMHAIKLQSRANRAPRCNPLGINTWLNYSLSYDAFWTLSWCSGNTMFSVTFFPDLAQFVSLCRCRSENWGAFGGQSHIRFRIQGEVVKLRVIISTGRDQELDHRELNEQIHKTSGTTQQHKQKKLDSPENGPGHCPLTPTTWVSAQLRRSPASVISTDHPALMWLLTCALGRHDWTLLYFIACHPNIGLTCKL